MSEAEVREVFLAKGEVPMVLKDFQMRDVSVPRAADTPEKEQLSRRSSPGERLQGRKSTAARGSVGQVVTHAALRGGTGGLSVRGHRKRSVGTRRPVTRCYYRR